MNKMEVFLKLSKGKPSKMADLLRIEEVKRKLGDLPEPLFKKIRELILRKCSLNKEQQMRVIILEFLEMDIFNVSIENCVSLCGG